MRYGRNFGENWHSANYGPRENLLEDYDAAVSPGMAQRIGVSPLNVQDNPDYIMTPAGVRRVGDWSYIHPGVPSDVKFHEGAVELRDVADMGRGSVRKATAEEVQRFISQYPQLA